MQDVRLVYIRSLLYKYCLLLASLKHGALYTLYVHIIIFIYHVLGTTLKCLVNDTCRLDVKGHRSVKNVCHTEVQSSSRMAQ